MGTTSEKLTYLNTTKTIIKDNLNLGGANITTEPFRAYSSKLKGIYKDFLAHGTDVLWNNWEKVSGSGETLTLNNTMEGKMKVDLKGNTQQNGTPTPDTPIPVQVVSGDNTIKVEGKNLFDNSYQVETQYGSTGQVLTNRYTLNNNIISIDKSNETSGVSYLNKLWLSQGTYTWSFDVSQSGNTTNYGRIRIHDWTNNIDIVSSTRVDIPSNKFSQTFTINSKVQISLMFIPNTNSDGTLSMSNIQLEKGSTASEFQPYQSQSYPIDLQSKNIFDGVFRQGNHVSTTTANRICSDNAIQSKSGNYYTLSTNLPNTYKWKIMNCSTNGTDTQVINDTNYTSSGSVSVYCGNNGYLKVLIGKTDDSNLTPSSISSYQFQVEEGNSATYYEKYYSIELCKIGTYQDRIVKDNGKWYLNKQIGKVVLDGTEDWTKGSQTNVSVFILSNVIYPQVYGENGVGLSNHFKYEYVNNANVFYFGWSNNVVIVMPNTYTLESFKTWLSSNNTSVYYITTPTYEEITDTTLLSQLEALAYSYEGTTNISQVNDDLAFVLDITALKEMS